jgi:hypothetical protein
VTYPDRDDFLERERAAERERSWREAEARAEFRRTGVCPRRNEASDPVRVYCPVCLHNENLHPGFTNPDPDLHGCLACHLKRKVRAARLPAELGSPRDCCPDAPICSH